MLRNSIAKSLFTVTICATLAACSSDKQIQGGESPDMVTDYAELLFSEVSIGQRESTTLHVTNLGPGPLVISSVTLHESTLDDSGAEFEMGDGWISSTTVGVDETISYTVHYNPQDEQPDSGYIEFATNDPKFEGGIARIPINTPALAPRIHSAQQVVFRRVPPITPETRDNYWQITEVQNTGSADLLLTDVIVTPSDSDYRITYPQTPDPLADPGTDTTTFPSSLAPGESFPIRVYFNPLDDLPSSAEMVFYSNDPLSPQYVVNLLGNSGSPCIELSEETEINFGEGSIGTASNKTVVVENCSATSELKISDIAVCTHDADGNCDSALPVFALNPNSLPEGLDAGEAVIAPRRTTSFVLSFTPEDVTPATGELIVVSDDTLKTPLNVALVGKGSDNVCPTAFAEASVAGSNRYETSIFTVPLQTVNFRGTGSTDTDGTIASYEWSVLQRPQGSTAGLTPSATAPEPSLFLDLAGQYEVELKVYDNQGMVSCDSSIITIDVVPGNDLHVQLVWDTPGDPDQTDSSGTDVDLHMLHHNGNGVWARSPWDCYYANKFPSWGATLDIDDMNGAGPENINLDDPEVGVRYAVGAHYWRASIGFGAELPSYVTVRIYIDGIQMFEEEKRLNNTDDFWHVADIQDRVITPIGTLSYL